jgi:signal peptidase I
LRKNERPAWRRFFDHGYVKLAVFISLSAASYLFFSRVVVMAVEVQGVSMSPTLQNGDLVLLNRFAYIRRLPQRGELVVLRDPETEELVVKRIIGMPEERVAAGADYAFVNGRLLFEPYIPQAAKTLVESPKNSILIPKDCFYVLGDNRHYSVDSRSFGPVQRERILGVINLQ